MITDDGKVGAYYLPLTNEAQAKQLLMGENEYSEETKKILYAKIK
jgi:hypothetical protein